MMTDRRSFLRTIAASGAATSLSYAKAASDSLGEVLPTRPLGKTGRQVTAFCLGGHHISKAENEKETQRLVERSIELGIRCFDNARNYHGGLSEKQYGLYLTPRFREQIYLTTKSNRKTAKEVRSDLERSLKAMKTDYLDLWQIHAIESPEDVDERIKNGVLDEFLKAREEGKARHLGFTGHTSFRAHLHMIHELKKRDIRFDTCLMPVNLVDPHYESFITNVLPVLVKEGYAVFAMKTMAFGRMLGAGPKGLIDSLGQTESLEKVGIGPKEMHHYVYSLPVCSLVSGCESVAQLEQNVGLLANYQGMTVNERDRLIAKTEPFAGKTMEHYKGKRRG